MMQLTTKENKKISLVESVYSCAYLGMGMVFQLRSILSFGARSSSLVY